eukprot:gene13704-biopygen15611
MPQDYGYAARGPKDKQNLVEVAGLASQTATRYAGGNGCGRVPDASHTISKECCRLLRDEGNAPYTIEQFPPPPPYLRPCGMPGGADSRAFGASVGRPPPPESNNYAKWTKQPRICLWAFGRPGARVRAPGARMIRVGAGTTR